MAQPRVFILRAPGTNCDEETAHAFALAGGLADRCHVNRLLEAPDRLADYQVLCIPGGFSYGDDIAAGRILSRQLQHHLADALQAFRQSDKLVLGICNGFQVLLQTKLLAASDEGGRPGATLTLNDSGRFEARWVRLAVQPGNCVFLQGMRELELPVAHAEGKFVARDEDFLRQLEAAGQLVLRYRTQASDADPAAPGYPDNPNGAMGHVAGLSDRSGRVLGLMPHPERFVDATQHPQWTRRPQHTTADGLQLFQNAVRYFS